jgi:hypothetical protein
MNAYSRYLALAKSLRNIARITRIVPHLAYADVVPLLLLLLLLPAVILALTPLLLIQRYRAGSARRQARPWVTAMTIAAMAFSAVFFLASAAFTTIWIPHAFYGAVIGMLIGLALGAIGTLLTRWEMGVRSFHYTPNRWLVLLVTLIVSARVAYGLYRSFEAARAGLSGGHLVNAFGVPESLAAGAIVIGYHLAYNVALRWQISRWQHRALRPL